MKKETLYRIFSNIPVLETKRLLLRRLTAKDARDMFDYAHRTDVTQFLSWKPHPDVGYSKEYLEYLEGKYAGGMFYDWGVVNKADGKMIGTCGFTSFNCTHNKGEVGYVLHPDYWGQGFAAEALERVLEFAFETLKLHRVEAMFIQENKQSLRVMEKVGMRLEGYQRESMLIKERYVTVGICSILADEWKANK